MKGEIPMTKSVGILMPIFSPLSLYGIGTLGRTARILWSC